MLGVRGMRGGTRATTGRVWAEEERLGPGVDELVSRLAERAVRTGLTISPTTFFASSTAASSFAFLTSPSKTSCASSLRSAALTASTSRRLLRPFAISSNVPNARTRSCAQSSDSVAVGELGVRRIERRAARAGEKENEVEEERR